MFEIGETMNWAIALSATFLVELFLSFTWNRRYFRFGIPVYVRHCEIGKGLTSQEITELVSAASSFSIRLIADREIAVREPFGILARGGLMHGIILLSPEGGTMKIIGYLDWIVLLFGVALFFLGSWLAFPFLVIILALYGFAKLRFDKLCANSKRPTAPESNGPGSQ